MPRITRALGLLVLLSVTSSAHAQTAEPSAAPLPIPRITLGEVTAAPGEGLMVPVYFTPDPNMPVRDFVLDIEYVSNNLKFQKAAAGPVAEKAGGKVEATIANSAPDDKSVVRSKLRLSVSLPEKQPADELPEGLLAYLMFELSQQAKPFVIQLSPSVISADDLADPPGKVTKLRALPGKVLVELGDMVPALSCFFFSH